MSNSKTPPRIPRVEFDRVLDLAVRCACASGKRGIDAKAILTHREPESTRWRWIVMATFRRAGYSYPAVGVHFGSDHSVAMFGCRKAEQVPLCKLLDDFALMAAVESVSGDDNEVFVRDRQATIASMSALPMLPVFEETQYSLDLRALEVSRLRQSAGDALGAALAAAADVYGAGDAAAWRKLEAAGDRLRAVAREALGAFEQGAS